MSSPATRFAPSPTGPLHLGHAWSALVAHDCARKLGGRFLLRIDDIDSGRVRAEYHQGIVDDLRWLGLVPDAPPLLQSHRIAAYSAALDHLREQGLAYPCFCTRAGIVAEIAASVSAPHGWGHGASTSNIIYYPGTCRVLDPAQSADRIAAGAPHAWRLNVDAALSQCGHAQTPLMWEDMDRGQIVADPAMHGPALYGDVIIARRDAPASYHLASTLDDAHLGISHVVRGADLFSATHIHRLLQALLALPTPRYLHHRLVTGPDGRRLAKRDAAASLSSLRSAGVDPLALVDGMRGGKLPLGMGWAEA